MEHGATPAPQDEATDNRRRGPGHLNDSKGTDKTEVAGEIGHQGRSNGYQKNRDRHAEVQHDGEAEQNRFVDVEESGHQGQTAQAAVLFGLGAEAHGQHQTDGAAGAGHRDEVGPGLIGNHVGAVGSGQSHAGIQQGLVGQAVGPEDGVGDGVDHRAVDAEHPEQG